jgi:hypothetical protein
MPNKLFHGDNLDVLREHVASESFKRAKRERPGSSTG